MLCTVLLTACSRPIHYAEAHIAVSQASRHRRLIMYDAPNREATAIRSLYCC